MIGFFVASGQAHRTGASSNHYANAILFVAVGVLQTEVVHCVKVAFRCM